MPMEGPPQHPAVQGSPIISPSHFSVEQQDDTGHGERNETFAAQEIEVYMCNGYNRTAAAEELKRRKSGSLFTPTRRYNPHNSDTPSSTKTSTL